MSRERLPRKPHIVAGDEDDDEEGDEVKRDGNRSAGRGCLHRHTHIYLFVCVHVDNRVFLRVQAVSRWNEKSGQAPEGH